MKNLILSLMLTITTPFATAALLEGPPSLPISTTTDKHGNLFDSPFPPTTNTLEIKGKQEYKPLQYSYWFDSGSGPGVLSYQYQNFYSDLLSPSYPALFMSHPKMIPHLTCSG